MVNVPAPLSAASGRRGYLRYQYGTHYWVPEVQVDWSRGMIRDTARVAIPPGGVYDAADYLLHQPGFIQKRGGTAYAGPAMTAANYASGVAFADFPAGSKIVAVGDNTLVYTVASGATTDVTGGGAGVTTIDTPKLRIGGGKNLLVFAKADGVSAPVVYTGAGTTAGLGGTPPAGKFAAVYKTRLALANSNAQPQRVYFSPTPDIEATWDTANSWLDTSYPVSGLAALNNVLLVFSNGNMQRIIGSTPPPNTDMDLAPVAAIGCSDARSIVVSDGYCYFANPRGIYLTNGSTPISLTKQGGIDSYWQGLFSSYDPATWTIASGMFRGFLIVCLLNSSRTLVTCLMCSAERRAWWRLTNIRAMMFANAIGVQDELYYADASTNRIVALSGIFNPTSTNKNDANGTAVAPFLETAPFGSGTGTKAYGLAHVDLDMRDAASDNPTMAVTILEGIEARLISVPAESPLAENSLLSRPRFTVGKEAQAVSLRFTQTNASSLTEIYAIEVESRGRPLTGEGVS